MTKVRAALVGLVVVVGCTSGETTTVPLGGDVCARVDGDVAIPSSVVARTSAVARITPAEALDRLVLDAVGAQEAKASGIDASPSTKLRVRGVLARAVLDGARERAASGGPPTDAEDEALSRQAWYEVDRPPMRLSVHAIVMRPKGKEAEELLPRARAFAEQIRAAVLQAKTADAMMSLASAKAKDSGKLEVKVEALSPVTADGRVPDGTSFDPAYVAGLFAIANVGDTSPVVESSFGFHVIRYVEALPEKRLSTDERRKLFGPEVNARRARAEIDRTLAALRASREVTVSPAAASILDGIEWGK